MKDPVTNSDILRALQAFESIRPVQPKEGWNQSLIEKLHSTAPHPSRKGLAPYAVLIIAVLLLNIGLFLKLVRHGSQVASERNIELQVIKHELLVHETDSNN